jgi:DNA-binding MarR family transcriptional regulator
MGTRIRGGRLFGSTRRTEVLLLLGMLGESYPSELARLLAAPPLSVTKILDGLEQDGIVASRMLGRTRRVSIDPRFHATRALQALLVQLGSAHPAIEAAAARRRSRPRRKGKPL